MVSATPGMRSRVPLPLHRLSKQGQMFLCKVESPRGGHSLKAIVPCVEESSEQGTTWSQLELCLLRAM